MAKPKGYPLPWCDKLDMPYWKVNIFLICKYKDWSFFQKNKSMREIIPVIDWLLERC